MPPKRKGKKADTGQIDGVNTTSMTREQLEAYTHRLKNELEREREERNFFQVERDKIRTFWEITQKKLDEEKSKVHAKYYELEAPIEIAENAVRENIQKMKYLQYENHKKVGEIYLKTMQENFQPDIELLKEMGELRSLISEKEEEFHLRIQELKMFHSQEISRIRNDFKNQEEEINQVNEEKFNFLKDDLTKKHQMELNEVIEKKDAHIKRIIDDTDKDFNKIKNYYEERTLKHLILIDALKNEVETNRNEMKELKSKLNNATVENQLLNSSLENVKENLNKFDKVNEKLYYCEKEKEDLSKYKTKCEQLKEELNKKKLENDTLLMLNKNITEEKNELWKKFENFITETQSEMKMKIALHEEHISTMNKNLENLKQNFINLLLSEDFNLEKLSTEVNKIFQIQDEIIRSLQCEIKLSIGMYKDLSITKM